MHGLGSGHKPHGFESHSATHWLCGLGQILNSLRFGSSFIIKGKDQAWPFSYGFSEDQTKPQQMLGIVDVFISVSSS